MFDLAWSEIALIAVVALVVIGPKDLPEAVRGAAKALQALRRKIGEFQTQADELVREAKLDDVRNQIHEVRSAVSEFRNFDLKGEVERTVDPDGSLKRGFSEPFGTAGSSASTGMGSDPVGGTDWSAPIADAPPPPAFIPPGTTAPTPAAWSPEPAPSTEPSTGATTGLAAAIASATAAGAPAPAASATLPPA